MGVPKFYRFISEIWPLINQAIEDSTLLPEYDALYLDLNGIIHGATHGNEGVSKKQTERDVVLAMMSYIDQMVKLIKPNRLLYMAVDGVAPRAKMNQQRSRRFRAARDSAQARLEAAARGEEFNDDDIFDSNCITPGTEFMDVLSQMLMFQVRKKQKEDAVWQRFKVVYSGHSVPGEGEHKIVAYIRAAKLMPGYTPNLRHCMAGLDADLVMLSLATHEPHFSLLREQIDFNAFRAKKFATKETTVKSNATKWQLLHIGVLREYLEINMKPSQADLDAAQFVYDGERVVDDFVLLAALCGNDFMPHLPSLDIGEGALNQILRMYRENLPIWGGYLCEGGLINFKRLESLLSLLGAMEADIFKTRAEEAEKFAAKAKKDRSRNRGVDDYLLGGAEAAGVALGGEDEDNGAAAAAAAGAGAGGGVVDESMISAAARADAEADMLKKVKERLAADRALKLAASGSYSSSGSSNASGAGESYEASDSSDYEGGGEDVDDFILADGDFKGRYYLEKFGITYRRGNAEDDAVLENLVRRYVEALQWVLLYYFRGCPAWGWFFPFHFAPMTSDLVGLTRFNIAFKLGQPFKPFQQLLGCLPAASSNFLPGPYRELMSSSSSPLIAFFPKVDEIKIDMNGKRNAWEGVTLIPFIEEKAMLSALATHCPETSLTAEERRRNTFGEEYIFAYDPLANGTLKSPNAAIFPDLDNCCTSAQVFTMPTMPVLTTVTAAAVAKATGLRAPIEEPDAIIPVLEGLAGSAHLYTSRPPVGCVVPAPGFHSLHTVHFSSSLQKIGLDIFGSKSKKETCVLAVGNGRRNTKDNRTGGVGGGNDHYTGGGHRNGGRGGGRGGGGYHHHQQNVPSRLASYEDEEIDAQDDGHMRAAHVPVFSTTYAPGTTVAGVMIATSTSTSNATTTIAAPECDLLSTWRAAHPGIRVSAGEMAPSVLGHTLYCNWPHLREGIVVALSDGLEEVTWNEAMSGGIPVTDGVLTREETMIRRPLREDEKVRWSQEAQALKTEVLSGGRGLRVAGVRIGTVDVIATLRTLQGMRRDPETGALSRMFGAAGSELEIKTVPQLMLASNPSPDPRFQECGPITAEQRFPVNTRVVILRGKARGCLARVIGYESNKSSGPTTPSSSVLVGNALLKLDVSVIPPEPAFGYTARDSVFDQYYDGRVLASKLQLTDGIFGKVTGSILVKSGHGFHAEVYDIGLNLKVHKKLFLPGYVRPSSSSVLSGDAAVAAWCQGARVAVDIAAAGPRGNNGGGGIGWEYTERVLDLVSAYQREFPEVFAMLENDPNVPNYDVKRFPGQTNAIVQVMTWLQQLDTYRRPLVPLTTSVLAPVAVKLIEGMVTKRKAAEVAAAASGAGGVSNVQGKEEIVVHAADVYAPEIQSYSVGTIGDGEGNLSASLNVDGSGMVPVLGDRVVNLSFKRAPLGSRGIVVAVHTHSGFVEVVFDEEFIGGSSLGGICSNGKGALVPWSSLLCVSRQAGDTTPVVPTAPRATALASSALDGTQHDRYDEGPRGKQGKLTSSSAATTTSSSSNNAGPHIAQGPKGSGFGGKKAPPQEQQQPQQKQQQQPQQSQKQKGGAAPTTSTTPAPLNMEQVSNQVEVYFSDPNLPRDEVMRKLIAEGGPEGWVAISALSNMPRLKEVSRGGDVATIASAVAEKSKFLIVSSDRKMVKRVKPWTGIKGGKTPTPTANTTTASPQKQQQQPQPQQPQQLAPAVAKLFSNPAPALLVPQSMPPIVTPPPVGGAVDMTSYWKRLMSTSVGTGESSPVTIETAPMVAPIVAPPTATAAPTTTTTTTTSSSTGTGAAPADRAHFMTLLQSISGGGTAAVAAPTVGFVSPPSLNMLLGAGAASAGQVPPPPLPKAAVTTTSSPAKAAAAAGAPTSPAKPAAVTSSSSSPATKAGGLMPSQMLKAKKKAEGGAQ